MSGACASGTVDASNRLINGKWRRIYPKMGSPPWPVSTSFVDLNWNAMGYPYPARSLILGSLLSCGIAPQKSSTFLERTTSNRGHIQWVRFTKSKEWRNDAIVAAIIASLSRIQEIVIKGRNEGGAIQHIGH